MKTKKTKVKMKDEDKELSIGELIKKMEKEFEELTDQKITLKAKKADDTVNGYIKTHMSDGERIIEMVLYQEDKDPDFEIYEYKGIKRSRGSKITKRKVVI